MGKLDGKVAVITGGASGMGRATVLRFLDEGAAGVVIADFNEGTGKETFDLAAERGHADRARFVRVDVSDENDVSDMIETAVEEFGRLDVVFNNAGVGGAFGPLAKTHLDDYRYTIDVLLTGVFFGIKHAARVMQDGGEGGAIVNTASVAGLSGGSGPQVYSAAKAAVINLTMTAAVELAPDHIRVNAICPGAINTPLANRGRPESAEEAFKSVQPLPIAGRPEHIAAAALFLASDESQFITGHALVVDGGLTAAGPNLMRGFAPSGLGRGAITGVNRGTTGLGTQVRERPTE